jgi:membrane protease YdiL (CAAX protease family)
MSLEQPLRAREGVRAPDAPPERQPVAPAPAAIEEQAASPRLLLLMLGLIAGWGLLMQRFGNADNIYAVMGPFALSVLLAVGALVGSELLVWLRASRRALLRSFVPELEGHVAALYTAAHRTTLAEALPWVLAIILAEEVLWRGALLHVLERRVPPALAMAISVATYAAAQFGTGSWIVMLLALVCGTLWTLQRHFTRSLLSPLLAHLIWTPTVILFYPVTSL